MEAKDIKAFIKLTVDNNRVGIISQLLKYKYLTTPVNISDADLVELLYNLYDNNVGAFYTIIKNAGWDTSNTNYTNSTEVRNFFAPKVGLTQLSVFSRLTPEEEQRENAATMKSVWETAADLLLGGSEESSTTVTVTESPAPGSQFKNVAIFGIIGLTVLLIIWLISTGKLKLG